MPNIIEIGQLWNDESEFFRDELYEAISENGVDWIPGQELFQSIHLAELSRNYLAVLRSVAERVWCVLDMNGNPHPVLHQNVYCHKDMIDGSSFSMIVNLNRNLGSLNIHEELSWPIVESVDLESGKIFLFNHHAWHSVSYRGDPDKYIMLVRASVEKISQEQ